MQRGMAKGLKVLCLFMITEVSIRCQKNPEVGIRRIPAYTPTPLLLSAISLNIMYSVRWGHCGVAHLFAKTDAFLSFYCDG